MMFCLIDCNNFFVSCERVFNPKLRKKPCVVLSNNDGCVVARSNEAKSLQIKMGDPIFLHKNLVSNNILQTCSSNLVLYSDMSNRIMQTIMTFGFDTEIYSIDEAFLKLDNIEENELLEIANQIKSRVEKWTGIPVSIGIAPTKTLAKIANEEGKKKNRIIILHNENIIDRTLETVASQDIWSIGSSSTKVLKRLNIINAKQLKYSDDITIKKHLKTPGYRTVLELRSIPCYSLNSKTPNKKSITCSRSFAVEKESYYLLKQSISSFIASATKKLRKQKSAASCITVYISTNRFKKDTFYTNSYTKELIHSSDYTPDFISAAEKALKEIYIKGLFYKKAGIILSVISEKKYTQLDIFSKQGSLTKKNSVISALDQINERYDKKTLFFAAEGIDKKQIHEKSNKSKNFTTAWNELLTININN